MTNDDDATLLLPLAEAAPRLGLHPANAQPRHDAATASPDDDLTAEVDYLRGELMATRARAARAEERAAAVRELAARLTAELAEARSPWWSRLFPRP